MTYTSEQRAIIERIGNISARMDETVARHHAAQAAAGDDLLNLGRNLIAAIERSNEITTLFRQHGDAFREFLDTL